MRWPATQSLKCARHNFESLPALRRATSSLARASSPRVSDIIRVRHDPVAIQLNTGAVSTAAAGTGFENSRRWASSRSSVRISARTKTRRRAVLPQGLLEADGEGKEEDGSGGLEMANGIGLGAVSASDSRYPPVIEQARLNIRRFENCVVLTRMGGFYELYFEHAQQYGPLLGLKVASKSTTGGDVPMAGFPHVHLDRYLKILVQDLNCYVALSQEILNDVETRLRTNRLYDRRVERVITPGTLIDEKFMDPSANNFCLAIYVDPQSRTKAQQQQSRSGREEANGETVVEESAVPDAGIEAGKNALNKLQMAEMELGLAWLDLSTGEFYTQKSTYGQLSSLLTRISAKEIVVSNGLQTMQKEVLLDILGPEQLIVTWQNPSLARMPMSDWQDMLDSPLLGHVVESFSSEETCAGSMVLKYVKTRLQDQDTKLQPPVRRLESESMIIDRHTLRGLEVLKTLRDSDNVGAKGSLLHACKRTQTPGGARLLRERMTRPSTVLNVIEGRLDLVEELLHRPKLREDIKASLKQTFDTTRLVQKFSIGRGEPDDLVNMSRTINLMQSTSELLRSDLHAEALCQLSHRFSLEQPIQLSERIFQAIDEQGLIASHESEEAEASTVTSTAQSILASKGSMEDVKAYGLVARAKTLSYPKLSDSAQEDGGDKWIMKKDASSMLAALHEELAVLRRQKTELVDKLRQQTGAESLVLHWSPRFGHHGYVNKKKDIKATTECFSVTRSDSNPQRTTRSFDVPEWGDLGREIDDTKLRVGSEERKVFVELRNAVVASLVHLRRNAAVLDELDVACSSATLAEEQHAVRPSLDNGTSLAIVGGRHPTVTLGLEEKGRRFVVNDCFMNTGGRTSPAISDASPLPGLSSFTSASEASSTSSPQPSSLPPSTTTTTTTGGERIHLITGPNMAGKSTYLRQNALLALMAQIGLFVPAVAAHVGLVDALFARIGSADNLFSDQSTFMTEMLETAAILRGATSRSLVVMDEVGRGTTPEDGFAVAYAALWHLARRNRCRALFASHFHGLADLAVGREWEETSEEDAGERQGEEEMGERERQEVETDERRRRRPIVGRYCTDVKELGPDSGAGAGLGMNSASGSAGFVFLHKVRPGVNRRSHALKVAGMAGLPASALDVAREVLKNKKEEARE